MERQQRRRPAHRCNGAERRWLGYWHLGAAVRYVGADEGTLRFRGRPESNVSSYYVDSGTLQGDHATTFGLESVWGRGPLLVSAEYARSWVDAPLALNPEFWGGYVVVSYVLTGEHRPYDKAVAYARRILPQNKWGAWELVGRHSKVDIDDRTVDGGVFDRYTIGINWWATRRWKIGFDYGHIDLDRSGLSGITHAFHTPVGVLAEVSGLRSSAADEYGGAVTARSTVQEHVLHGGIPGTLDGQGHLVPVRAGVHRTR